MSVLQRYLRIDRNFCSVHEEITSIRLCTSCNRVTQGCIQPDWGYFEWTEQIISINPYKLIQTFFAYDIEIYIYFFKIRQMIGKNLNNPQKSPDDNGTRRLENDVYFSIPYIDK